MTIQCWLFWVSLFKIGRNLSPTFIEDIFRCLPLDETFLNVTFTNKMKSHKFEHVFEFRNSNLYLSVKVLASKYQQGLFYGLTSPTNFLFSVIMWDVNKFFRPRRRRWIIFHGGYFRKKLWAYIVRSMKRQLAWAINCELRTALTSASPSLVWFMMDDENFVVDMTEILEFGPIRKFYKINSVN